MGNYAHLIKPQLMATGSQNRIEQPENRLAFLSKFWQQRFQGLLLFCNRSPVLCGLIFYLLGMQAVPMLTTHILFIALALLIGLTLVIAQSGKRKVFLTLFATIVALTASGAWHWSASQPTSPAGIARLAARVSQPIAVRGVVATAAIWKPNPNYRQQNPNSEPWRTQWHFEVESHRDGNSWAASSGRTLLTVDGRITNLLPGDRIEVFGAIRKLPSATNPGAFDMAEHFSWKGIHASLSVDDVKQMQKLEQQPTYVLRRLRAQVVRHVDQQLQQHIRFGKPEIAAALVFGQREQVDWEQQQELMATGTLHLLAISGLHVELVAVSIAMLCTLLSLRNLTKATWIIILCVCYAILAGGKPPVIRALILVTIASLATMTGRRMRLENALATAGLVLLVFHAANLTNVGVHLSFLAVVTIGVFAIRSTENSAKPNPVTQLVEKTRGLTRQFLRGVLRGIASGAWISITVWLVTSPIVWANFHVVAPISILLNVCLAPLLVVSLLSGLTTGLLGALPFVGTVSGTICGCALACMETIIGFGDSVPFGHFWLPAPPEWWTVAHFAIIAGWLLCFGRSKAATLMCLLACWLFIGVLITRSDLASESLAPEQVDELHCTFVDVGHGCSVIIELPNGHTWLYDAGHLGLASRGYQAIASALWETPTHRIDRLIISHADLDHYNAVEGLLERFDIAEVVSTTQFWSSQEPDALKLIEQIHSRNIPFRTWNAGDGGNEDELTWSVVHPSAKLRATSDNAASLCLVLEYGGRHILLPGDLEGSGLNGLVHLPPRPCEILMAPHHGSLALDPKPLLQWCQPKVTVISGNHRAARTEVVDAYSTPNCQLGITFRDGAIQTRISSNGTISSLHWEGGEWKSLHNR